MIICANEWLSTNISFIVISHCDCFQDLLLNDNIELDEVFKMSLIEDIVKVWGAVRE